MKKKYGFIGIVVLACILLSACGKSEAVKQTEGLINAIGEVSLEAEETIKAAEEAFNALSDKEKETVENISTLTSARESVNSLIAVKQTEELIDAIGEVSLDSEDAIVAAETAFNALSDKEKELVENSSALITAREEVDKLNSIIGTWIKKLQTSDGVEFSYIEFKEDGSGIIKEKQEAIECKWKIENDILMLLIDNDIMEYKYKTKDNKLGLLVSVLYSEPHTMIRDSVIEENKDLIIGTWKGKIESERYEITYEFKDDGTGEKTYYYYYENDVTFLYSFYWEKTEDTIKMVSDKDNIEKGYNHEYEVNEDSLTIDINCYNIFERF